MQQLSLIDLLFGEEQNLTDNNTTKLMEKQSNLSSNITASNAGLDVRNSNSFLSKYQSLKEQYPTCLLLFRVGDFYEAYNQDAQDASKILGITLTKRNSINSYLAGFPYHALDKYLPKLVKAGRRVAICDQINDNKQPKEIVKRFNQPYL